MNQISKTTSYIYGVVLILGGILGFVKAGSTISLLTGLTSGLLVFLSCKIGTTKPKEGYLYVAAISLVLAIFFTIRFAATSHFMPNGLMLVLSTMTFVIVGLNYLKNK